MSHLPRQEILNLLSGTTPLLQNTPALGSQEFEESLQPDSYDLRIGLVAANGEKVIGDHQEQHMLPPGEMAIVLTRECVNMPLNLAAEVSPPNYLLSRGLLVVVPSHVDPGYAGPLTARVINLLNKPYRLAANEHILTIHFYKLEPATDTGYRHNRSRADKISETIRESRDSSNKLFLNQEDIVFKKELKREATVEALFWVSVLLPAIGVIIPFTIMVTWKWGMNQLERSPWLVDYIFPVLLIILAAFLITGSCIYFAWVWRLLKKRKAQQQGSPGP